MRHFTISLFLVTFVGGWLRAEIAPQVWVMKKGDHTIIANVSVKSAGEKLPGGGLQYFYQLGPHASVGLDASLSRQHESMDDIFDFRQTTDIGPYPVGSAAADMRRLMLLAMIRTYFLTDTP